ncbi:hypothetical protein B1987_07590 [Mycobacterium kansasii]|nr:hypothetical protein B1987_07590 [Mycobacterium kansasii]VBA57803.1 hypothetical protein LAUMK191_04199 [Mycobacterium attenuatum]
MGKRIAAPIVFISCKAMFALIRGLLNVTLRLNDSLLSALWSLLFQYLDKRVTYLLYMQVRRLSV